MDIFKEFALDEERVASGVWRLMDKKHFVSGKFPPIDESEIGDQPAVLVASTDNPRYTRVQREKIKPHVMRAGTDGVDHEDQERAVGEAIAECIILNWKNLELQGQPFPYSKALVVEIWTKPKWAKLKQILLAMIGDTDVFKAVQEEAIVKN